MSMYRFLQFGPLDPAVTHTITIVEAGGIPDVTSIIIMVEKSSNCSIIEDISIDKCWELGELCDFKNIKRVRFDGVLSSEMNNREVVLLPVTVSFIIDACLIFAHSNPIFNCRVVITRRKYFLILKHLLFSYANAYSNTDTNTDA